MALMRNEKRQLLAKRKERLSKRVSRCCFRTECLVSALLVGLLALFVTWGSSAIVKAGYELVQARASLTKVEKQNEIMRLEISRLKSPQRIREIAAGQLGMVNPPAVYVAVRNSAGPKPVQDEALETVAYQPFILFGNSRAEARDLGR